MGYRTRHAPVIQKAFGLYSIQHCSLPVASFRDGRPFLPGQPDRIFSPRQLDKRYAGIRWLARFSNASDQSAWTYVVSGLGDRYVASWYSSRSVRVCGEELGLAFNIEGQPHAIRTGRCPPLRPLGHLVMLHSSSASPGFQLHGKVACQSCAFAALKTITISATTISFTGRDHAIQDSLRCSVKRRDWFVPTGSDQARISGVRSRPMLGRDPTVNLKIGCPCPARGAHDWER